MRQVFLELLRRSERVGKVLPPHHPERLELDRVMLDWVTFLQEKRGCGPDSEMTEEELAYVALSCAQSLFTFKGGDVGSVLEMSAEEKRALIEKTQPFLREMEARVREELRKLNKS